MKKLNNRQNQVKSLDFQNNILFNFGGQNQQHQQSTTSSNGYGQILEVKSPQIMKDPYNVTKIGEPPGFRGHLKTVDSQKLVKTNQHHYAPSQQLPMGGIIPLPPGGQQFINQIDSTQSFKSLNSHLKSNLLHEKHNGTKTKQRSHKKTISLTGGVGVNVANNTAASLQTKNLLADYHHSTQPSSTLAQTLSQNHNHTTKQTTNHTRQNSGAQQQQYPVTKLNHNNNSINEYNSSSNNNNIIVMNYGGDVQIFPKIDNFIIGGSTTSPEKRTPESKKQQQQIIEQTHIMQMKNYQKIINEAQQMKQGKITKQGQAKQFLVDSNIKSSFESNNFNNTRPPLNQGLTSQITTGHPSQRISIISSNPEDSNIQPVNYLQQLTAGIKSSNQGSRVYNPINSAAVSIKASSTFDKTNKQSSKAVNQVAANAGDRTISQENQRLQQQMAILRDSEITVLHDSPPEGPKTSNINVGRQMKKNFQHHQRTFSDVPTSQMIISQHAKNQMMFNDNLLASSLQTSNGIPSAAPGLNSNRRKEDSEQKQFSNGIQSYEDSKHGSLTRGAEKNLRKMLKKGHVQSIDSNSSSQHAKNSLISSIQNVNLASTSSRQQQHTATAKTHHQHHLTDERDVLFHLLQSAGNHVKNSPSITNGNDLKTIYQGNLSLKDHIQKTKHALKLTQTQFGGGGHSRKVVSTALSKLNGGTNTQSFRISQQNTTSIVGNNGQSIQSTIVPTSNPGSALMMSQNSSNLQKMAPKIYLSKTKKNTKQPSINNSSQGARASTNMTKIQNAIGTGNPMAFINDGRLQKYVAQGNSRAQEVNYPQVAKAIYTAGPQSHGGGDVSINFQGALADIMARTSTKAALLGNIDHNGVVTVLNTNFLKQQQPINAGVNHKRSVSDGSTIFQSLISNRGSAAPQILGGPSFDNTTIQVPTPGNIYKSSVGSGKKTTSKKSTSKNHNQTQQKPQPPTQEFLRSTFHKESSMTKIANAPYDQITNVQNINFPSERLNSAGKQTSNYVQSHRSQQTNSSQNTKIGSHRLLIDPNSSRGIVSKKESIISHHRNMSHQITIEPRESNPQRERGHSIGGTSNQNNNNGTLPKPPPSAKQNTSKNTTKGLKRNSSKQGAEIIIEDQGTPQNKMLLNSPQSQFNIEENETLRSSKNEKDRLLQILNKRQQKQQFGKQALIEQIQSSQNRGDQQQPDSTGERIDTLDSVASDPNHSPRTKKNVKLAKFVRLAFQKTNNPPATSSEFYKVGKVMGKGAFGKVNLAMHRLSGKFVALKSINKTFLSEEASKRKVMQEFNILQRTRHRNIVRLYESFETPQHIVFVMEVCGAGDLLTYVRRRRKLKEDVAKHLFKQIIEGLRYCHARGILHRDIKLDNILLTSEGDIKICDFGVSKLAKSGERMKEQCGTPAYIAPEVFEGQGYEGFASDVWSAGVVLYAMLYGTVPFKASNMTELQRQICKGQTTFKDEISSESINLLQGILEKDPQQRLSIAQILRHPWMQNIPKSINVFTDLEKEKVNQEFAYYNMKGDQNEGGDAPQSDPFAEHMSLNSTQNSLVKNVSTKSVILAPFNSTRTHIDDNFYQRDSIQDMMIDKRVIKFAAKVKDVDRQYEANNNAELDNGVYHQDDDEIQEKEEEEEEKKEVPKKIQKQDDESLQREIEEGQKMQKQSEWQKIERMMIKKQRIEDESKEKEVNLMVKATSTASQANLVMDQNVIAEIEKNGFPRHYIQASLTNDELNYVTAYYYLLCTEKEF